MPTLRFSVAPDEAGARLDSALAARPEIESRSLAERLVRDGAVRVDGIVRSKSHRLEAGSIVEAELPAPAAPPSPEHVSVRVLLADDALVVIEKPAGLVVHPGAGVRDRTLVNQLLTLGAAGGPDPLRPGIVHRLDKDTSGLLVVTRSQDAYEAMCEAIRRREVERRYLALVRGHPRSRTGRIDAPIGRDRRDPTRRSLDTDEPREAVTHFEIVETTADHTLLDIRLETGRTHQIRVHLAAIELPIAGDPLYGIRGDLGLDRQFLHANGLRFTHPVTGEEIDLDSPLPADLQDALERARRGRGQTPRV